MFGARHGKWATASLLVQLAFAIPSHASDSPTTVIVATNPSDPRLARALVLLKGELSALGVDVQARSTEAVDAPGAAAEIASERLSLDVKDGTVVVRVFAAGATVPLVESVDLDGPEVTAEVVAVRAVEALRAARLLPTADPRIDVPAAPAPPAPTAVPSATAPTEAPSEQTLPIVQLALGSSVLEHLRGAPQLDARAGVRVGPRWGFVGLGAEGSLTEPEFAGRAGAAQVARRALFLQLGARVRLRHEFELSARAGLEYLHYAAKGAAAPGYLTRDLNHDTGAVSFSLGGAYYFVPALGVTLDLSSVVAFDAARIRVADEEVVALDHPSLAIGAGLLLGAF